MRIVVTIPVLAAVLSACAAPRAAIDFAARAEGHFRGTVRRAQRHDHQMGVIELFYAAYYFCASGRHLDALDTLFDVATEMQDRDPASRTYGNYRWYYRDGFVMDHNAVDFCMQPGSYMAREHRAKMTPAQRTKFEKLLERSIQGCLNHRVRPSYTNIAIMNAVNLVLLGEACGRPDAFAEGVERLDAFVLNTALFGVCEYASPTYTAVDILNLHRLHAGAKDPGVKATCEKLLKLFWTDACASAFPGAGRLGGPHSRDYDYLYGMGGMAELLRAAGVAPVGAKRSEPLEFMLDDWRPDAATRALATKVGRYVESRWGEDEEQTRSYWAGRHVALGVAGANYWNMDIPLAVDFASTNRLARGYFIADGRRDPYGTKRIPEGTGPHQKTLHLRPFWAGVQRACDALGLAVYRVEDVAAETPTLESHFVFPRDVDEIWLGNVRVKAERGRPFARPLSPGTCVFARKGGGAFGVRVPWARDLAGAAAQTALVWDDALNGEALRVTVAHHDVWGHALDPARLPMAAFWVRVCDAADDAVTFAAFRTAFATASCDVRAADDRVELEVASGDGGLALAASAPFLTPSRLEPAPYAAVLAVDGRDLGAGILGDVPGVAAYRAERARAQQEMEANTVRVFDLRAARWEAEKGVVVPNMVVAKDAAASDGSYVWAPGRPGERGGGNGSVSWQLLVEKAGTYHLWGRVSTATQEDDSFFVLARAGECTAKGRNRVVQILAPTEWHLGQTQGRWRWTQFPERIELPKGPVILTVRVREDGAKLDQVFLSPDESDGPEAR